MCKKILTEEKPPFFCGVGVDNEKICLKWWEEDSEETFTFSVIVGRGLDNEERYRRMVWMKYSQLKWREGEEKHKVGTETTQSPCWESKPYIPGVPQKSLLPWEAKSF